MSHLTAKQRKLCDEFEAFLKSLNVGGVRSISLSHEGAVFVHGQACHISKFNGTLADRIDNGLSVFAECEPSEEIARQNLVADLKRQLADLGEAV